MYQLCLEGRSRIGRMVDILIIQGDKKHLYSFNLKILHTLKIGEGGKRLYNNIFL